MNALASRTQTIEVATIIPEGTPAAAALKDFAKSVDSDTKQAVNFKFKWGGSAGTDPDVLESIKRNELQGAMFAGQIMDQIAPITREGEIPFQFGSDRQKARAFVVNNSKNWQKSIESSGFHNIGFYEVGFVYLCGKRSVKQISDMKAAKVWLWPGDKLGRIVLEDLKATAIEAPVQDSFKALIDGRMDFAYAPAIAMVALQWYTKANHVITEPISYATGSIIIYQSVWKRISVNNQAIIAKQATTLINKLNEAAQADELESISALKSMGVKFSSLSPSDLDTLNALNKSIAKKWRSHR